MHMFLFRLKDTIWVISISKHKQSFENSRKYVISILVERLEQEYYEWFVLSSELATQKRIFGNRSNFILVMFVQRCYT